MTPLGIFVAVLLVALVLLLAWSLLTIAAQNTHDNTPADKDETS